MPEKGYLAVYDPNLRRSKITGEPLNTEFADSFSVRYVIFDPSELDEINAMGDKEFGVSNIPHFMVESSCKSQKTLADTGFTGIYEETPPHAMASARNFYSGDADRIRAPTQEEVQEIRRLFSAATVSPLGHVIAEMDRRAGIRS